MDLCLIILLCKTFKPTKSSHHATPMPFCCLSPSAAWVYACSVQLLYFLITKISRWQYKPIVVDVHAVLQSTLLILQIFSVLSSSSILSREKEEQLQKIVSLFKLDLRKSKLQVIYQHFKQIGTRKISSILQGNVEFIRNYDASR